MWVQGKIGCLIGAQKGWLFHRLCSAIGEHSCRLGIGTFKIFMIGCNYDISLTIRYLHNFFLMIIPASTRPIIL